MILNIINNKYYIGNSSNLKIRFKNHIHKLSNNKHENQLLQNAWNKYGADNFKFYILEFTNNLIEREQHWLDHSKAYDRKIGYNLSTIAGSLLGIKRSSETKAKMSLWQIGRKRTQQAIQNMKIGMKGRIISEQHRLDISKGNKGKIRSKETKIKMSIAAKERWMKRKNIS